jgi:hypothetical protein
MNDYSNDEGGGGGCNGVGSDDDDVSDDGVCPFKKNLLRLKDMIHETSENY